MTFVESLCPVVLTACSGTRHKQDRPHIFIDIEIRSCGPLIHIIPTHANRGWVMGWEPFRQRTSTLRWPDRPPCGFNSLHATLQGRIRRTAQRGLPSSVQAMRGLEELAEWHLLGYPLRLLRSVAQSLPSSLAALALHRATRACEQFVMQSRKAMQPFGQSGDRGGGDRPAQPVQR